MNDWIDWMGKDCPEIDGLRCDIRFRDGTVMEGENCQDWWNNWCWVEREPKPTDIVAYRVSE